MSLPGWQTPAPTNVRDEIRTAFDSKALKRICLMKDTDFWHEYGIPYPVDQSYPYDYFVHKDNGSNILGIAHLDSVDTNIKCSFADTGAGLVVHSGALDDRLGAYVILDLLPKLGITCDWLLTTGEESGRSTAKFFEIDGKQYNWMFQFDRGGTDVVMYDYECKDLRDRVKETGAIVGNGSFSDICSLQHLNCKGVNWGVGYRDYHGPRSHAYLEDTFRMVEQFVRFYHNNLDEHLDHTEREKSKWDWTDYRSSGTKKSSENSWDYYDNYTYKSWKEKNGLAVPNRVEDAEVLKIHDLPQPVNNVDDILESGR